MASSSSSVHILIDDIPQTLGTRLRSKGQTGLAARWPAAPSGSSRKLSARREGRDKIHMTLLTETQQVVAQLRQLWIVAGADREDRVISW